MMVVKLLPVALRNAGTADAESLVSYIYRSSLEHGVYVGKFLRFVYRQGIAEIGGPEGYPRIPRSMQFGLLVRPNKTTKMIAKILELMTDQNMQSSLLGFLDSSLGRSAGEVSDDLRWCPECFSEMKKSGEDAYLKLIWHLLAIKHCPVHRTPLVKNCENCGCNQKSFKRNCSVDICQQCGNDLSVRKYLDFDEIANSWETSSGDILKLFDDLAENEFKLDRTGVPKSMEKIFDYYVRNDREDELYEMILKDELRSVMYKQEVIDLKKVRRFAYGCGMDISDILWGMSNMSSEVLHPSWSADLPPNLQRVSHKNRRNHSEVLAQLRAIIESVSTPPSLKSLARKADVSVGYLEYRFPDLAREVVSNHKQHRDEELQKKRDQAKANALAFFVEERYFEHTKSRKEAYRVLREETGLPKFMLKQAIQDAFSKIYTE